MDKVLFSKESDEWETPDALFEELNNEFNFIYDLCATRENTKVKKGYYRPEQNSLQQDWDDFDGNVWCNPPYSNIKEFVKKAYECNSCVVMLVPARTDTKWFHDYVYNKQEIRFIKGRLKFKRSIDLYGDKNYWAIPPIIKENSAPFPSMLIIFNNHKKR